MKTIILKLIIIILFFSCKTLGDPQKVCNDVVEVNYISPYSAPYVSSFEDELNHPFPRLAMWWPSSWHQDVNDLAKYDYIGWGFWEDFNALKKIKELNPNQLHFMSGTITETSWYFWQDKNFKDIVSKIPGEFFLTSNGADLTQALNDTNTNIKVNKILDSNGNPLFKPGDTVVCGYESMKIVSVDINNYSLEVERGFYRNARYQDAGTRIAPHITFWPETWVMNLSDLCPQIEIDGGKYNWREWAVKYYLPEIYPNSMDGYILDRLEEGQSWLVGSYTSSIVPEFYSVVETEDYSFFDVAWKTGIRNAIKDMRESLNVPYIVANSFGAHYDLLNGCIYEGMPTNWSDTRPLTYNEWAIENTPYMLGENGYINVSQTTYPNFSFVESYEISEWYDEATVKTIAKKDPNQQHMRFGLSSALLGDGYFSYETSTQGHGKLRLYWFNEYDDAGRGKGYLGYPLGNYQELLTLENSEKVFTREFENGLAVCNPTDRCIEVTLENNWRLVTGEEVNKIHLEPRDGQILVRID